ncbi:galactosylceramide sulfotransferase-like isoform X2 [Artemia franciscana]|uniref:galactosylceramide sulfotransferase-like isoform X2 n=1 Tax=Artemia franciscana TaxID=6661 RepID=UPI0032DBA4D5
MKVKQIVFVKSYKVSGTAITEVLMRLAWLYLRTIDVKWKSHFLHSGIYESSVAHKKINFDVLSDDHWNESLIQTLGMADALHITSLREPVDAFESLFHYVDMRDFYGVSSITEFVRMINGTSARINTRMNGKWGRNQLSFALGLPEIYFDSEENIRRFVKKVEQKFDLVMISEYYEESLVILKDMLRVPLLHVMSAKSNVRHNDSKAVLSHQEGSILSKWLKADVYLYQVFRRSDLLCKHFFAPIMGSIESEVFRNSEVKRIFQIKDWELD